MITIGYPRTIFATAYNYLHCLHYGSEVKGDLIVGEAVARCFSRRYV